MMDLVPRFITVKVTPATTWLFVSLSDGYQNGWGEATLHGQESAVAALANALPDRLGQSDIAALPLANLPQAALASSLHQALADVLARQNNLSLSEHLGGTARRGVGVYANINRCSPDRSPESMAANARRALAQGHTAIKIAPFDEVRPTQNRADMSMATAKGLARIEAVRTATGPGRLMVDCHWRFNVAGAEALIDACVPFDLHWIECPIAETPDVIPTLKALRARANATGTRLAGLETAILRAGFAPYIQAGAYDVMMPDVKYCGGPREMLAIAADMADSGIEFSPHNPSGPICHAHSLHLCAALPKGDLLEMQFDETPMFNSLVGNAVPQPLNGQITLPGVAAGLGLSLDPSPPGFLQ